MYSKVGEEEGAHHRSRRKETALTSFQNIDNYNIL